MYRWTRSCSRLSRPSLTDRGIPETPCDGGYRKWFIIGSYNEALADNGVAGPTGLESSTARRCSSVCVVAVSQATYIHTHTHTHTHTHNSREKPIVSASANRAVHQRTECGKKHNRAPNRVPIREILAARRGVAYSRGSGGCAGACGVAVL